jgi:hypothetical protein
MHVRSKGHYGRCRRTDEEILRKQVIEWKKGQKKQKIK